MLYIIYLVGGICIGFMVSIFFCANYIHYNTYGTIRQAHDDGETYLFLELDRPPEEIKQRKRVVFKVNPNDYDTQD